MRRPRRLPSCACQKWRAWNTPKAAHTRAGKQRCRLLASFHRVEIRHTELISRESALRLSSNQCGKLAMPHRRTDAILPSSFLARNLATSGAHTGCRRRVSGVCTSDHQMTASARATTVRSFVHARATTPAASVSELQQPRRCDGRGRNTRL